MNDLPAATTSARIREQLIMLALVLVAAWFLFDPQVQQANAEGDELVHAVLTEQLSRGLYTLRGTPVLHLPGFSANLYDRAIHYHPPLYNYLLLVWKMLFGPAAYVRLSCLASAGCAYFVYLITRRRASLLAAAGAAGLYLGCPIVYLASCRVWAEATLSLWMCAAADLCDRAGKRSDAPTPRPMLVLSAVMLAAAMTKATVLFALPGLVWLSLAGGRVNYRWLALLVGVPLAVTLLWGAYTTYVNAASPPASALPDDRFAINAFVAEMAAKPPLSLFYLPWLLNPGHVFAVAAWHRARWRDSAPFFACVLVSMAAFSALAWLGRGTYHTKYISCVMPMLAIVSGIGIDALASRPSRLLRATLVAFAVLLLSVLLYENAVNRHTWVAEVSPALYWGIDH